MVVYLIRHGMTQANISKKFVGRTEYDVTDEGISNIRENIKNNIYPDVDIIYSSPMKRCIQTANEIFPDKKVNIIDELIEMDFGLYEGLTYEEIEKQYPGNLESFRLFDFPEGENMDIFTKRCVSGFEKVLSKNEDCAVVCHGGVIMALMSVYGIPKAPFYDWYVNNATGYKLVFENNTVTEVKSL